MSAPAATSRRRFASRNVTPAMVTTGMGRLPWPVIAAHDVEKNLFERPASTFHLVHLHVLLNEPSRERRQGRFSVHTQMHRAVPVYDVAPELTDAREDGGRHG